MWDLTRIQLKFSVTHHNSRACFFSFYVYEIDLEFGRALLDRMGGLGLWFALRAF